jgi:hypothetical protein
MKAVAPSTFPRCRGVFPKRTPSTKPENIREAVALYLEPAVEPLAPEGGLVEELNGFP